MSAKNVTSCLYVIFDTIIRFTARREEGNSTEKRVHSGINRDLASRAHGKVFSKGKLFLDRYWRGRNGADSKSLPFRPVLRDSIWFLQFLNIPKGFRRLIYRRIRPAHQGIRANGEQILEAQEPP
ncbi:hypothetical protein B0H16DRAFT_1453929 [Mycena metata]|uniref:Uncharacterized protein n=1 Tax=Mycena metata TaxID=1033252 RepID=A0AAD7JJC5_9AGAR|nr:hypothetical protein B0H16DRAFT_1453929 [Mycena metata]